MISKEDIKRGYNDILGFPVILNPRTAFVTRVKLNFINTCIKVPWIDFLYLNETDINYNEIIENLRKNNNWSLKNDIRFKRKKIFLKGD